jgi:hypothetical protein
MWKLKVKIEGLPDLHTVYGMGMAFPGFNVIEQASSFITKHLDNYLIGKFGVDVEIEEVLIKFEDRLV